MATPPHPPGTIVAAHNTTPHHGPRPPANHPQTTPAPTFTVVPSPAATPAAAPVKKRGGLNLGGIGAAAPATKGGKTYPVATLTDEQKAMVSDLLAQTAQYKALEGSIESLKKEVNALVMPQWFGVAQGQIDPPSSMIVPGLTAADKRAAAEKAGTPVLPGVTLTDDQGMLVIAGETGGRYIGTAEAAAVERIAAMVGEDKFAAEFMEKIALKISLDKVADDTQQALVDDLLAVFTRHNAMHAVEAKTLTTFRPLARKSRFQTFDLPTNLAIHEVLPIIPTFKRRA